jgi:hypothetical protein
MGSREHLWSIYGDAWGWPAAAMAYQQDREDLARHQAGITAYESFNYAFLDDAGTALHVPLTSASSTTTRQMRQQHPQIRQAVPGLARDGTIDNHVEPPR